MTSSPNARALSLSDAATILTNASKRRVTVEMLRDAIDKGMPTEGQDIVNLVHVCAWLNRELHTRPQEDAHDR